MKVLSTHSCVWSSLMLVSLNGHGVQAYAIVFIVLISRTICDYAFAWKEFYSVYTAQ
jgi:hypothetical protein